LTEVAISLFESDVLQIRYEVVFYVI